VLAEDDRFEPVDARAVPPGVRRQTGLGAGLREKRLGVPPPLGGHLRQQQAAPNPLLDDQSVAADLDAGRVNRIDRLERILKWLGKWTRRRK